MGRKIKEGALFYIYEVKNKANGKTYIGQHHYYGKIKDYYYGSGILIMKALKRYGKTGFDKTIIISGIKTKDEINELEKYYIEQYRSMGKAEYNISIGGEGSTGFHHTMEARLQMSVNRKGYVWSKEAREKLSKSSKGHPVSAEQRMKLSIANKGRPNKRKGIPLSSAHRAKISKSNTGKTLSKERREHLSKIQMGKNMGKDNPHAKSVICIETGEIFGCTTDVARKYCPDKLGFTGITKCCKNRNKTALGLHWAYQPLAISGDAR